jgi:predicted Fe-Mo cluster-binding NifX family protein
VKIPFGTRLEPDLRQQLKVYAAATDQTIEDIVEAAIRGYLPGAPAETEVHAAQQQDAVPAL